MENPTIAAGLTAKESTDRMETRETKELKWDFPAFALATAAFALLCPLCLYKNPSGITYPLYVAGLLAYFRLCFRKLAIARKKGLLPCEICLLLLGLSVALTDSSILNGITKKGILLLLFVYLLHTVYDDHGWDFVKYLSASFWTLLAMLENVPSPFLHAGAYSKERPADAKRTDTVKYVLIGLAASVPLLALLILLLGLADMVFASYIERFFYMLKVWDLFLITFLAVWAFFLAYCLLAALCQRSVKEECEDRRRLEPLPAIIVTGLSAIVYLFFCVIQAVYLFAGQGQIPNGCTYAGYARQGFFELLAVCLMNLGIVVGCTSFFKESRLLKGILAAICACTYVMLASSAFRMLLYVGSYGLTFLRVIVLWALAVIAVLMAGVAAHLFCKDFPLFRFGVVVVAVCYLGLALSHPDYYIARYNTKRYFSNLSEPGGTSHADIDIWYLSSLSSDAAPILLDTDTYQQMEEHFSDEEMDDIGRYRDRIKTYSQSRGIRSFNLSRFLSGLSIRQLEASGQ